MEKYVKEKTNIAGDFITDFFNFSKKYQQNQFIIDFQSVVKWSSLTKENLKEVLVSKFEDQFDYQRVHESENYLLTPNCFKELCLLMQTTKSKEIRKNYILVENIIYHYLTKKKQNIKRSEKVIYIVQPVIDDTIQNNKKSCDKKNNNAIKFEGMTDNSECESSIVNACISLIIFFILMFISTIVKKFIS